MYIVCKKFINKKKMFDCYIALIAFYTMKNIYIISTDKLNHNYNLIIN